MNTTTVRIGITRSPVEVRLDESGGAEVSAHDLKAVRVLDHRKAADCLAACDSSGEVYRSSVRGIDVDFELVRKTYADFRAYGNRDGWVSENEVGNAHYLPEQSVQLFSLIVSRARQKAASR